jgi:hypothetical protein
MGMLISQYLQWEVLLVLQVMEETEVLERLVELVARVLLERLVMLEDSLV